MNAEKRRVGVSIFEVIPASKWGSSYEIEVMSFAEFSHAHAVSEAKRIVTNLSKGQRVISPTESIPKVFVAKIEPRCPACSESYRGRALEPGYKRKVCSFCDGSGRV